MKRILLFGFLISGVIMACNDNNTGESKQTDSTYNTPSTTDTSAMPGTTDTTTRTSEDTTRR